MFSDTKIQDIDSGNFNIDKKELIRNNRSKKEILIPYNILLYGFSSLTIKSICGFRDEVIKKLVESYSKLPSYRYHKKNIEKLASHFFRFFICEAQPKTQADYNGELVYHDGIRYSIELKKLNFHRIHIIPDAISGTLLENCIERPDGNNPGHFVEYDKLVDIAPSIHFFMVGANGYDDDGFIHSAGHLAIIDSVKNVKKRLDEGRGSPRIILSTLTSKKKIQNKSMEDDASIKQNFDRESEPDFVKDEWLVRNSFAGEEIRKKIFISKSSSLKSQLRENEISLYNPKEDRIMFERKGNNNKTLDVAITEINYGIGDEKISSCLNLKTQKH